MSEITAEDLRPKTRSELEAMTPWERVIEEALERTSKQIADQLDENIVRAMLEARK